MKKQKAESGEADRESMKAAKEAREAAHKAREAADEAAEAVNDIDRKYESMKAGKDIAIVWRLKTEADRKAEAAADEAHKAREAADRAAATNDATAEAKAKEAEEAEAKAKAAAKLAKEAEATAPRLFAAVGYSVAGMKRPAAALAVVHKIADRAADLAKLSGDIARTTAAINIFSNPANIEAAARCIAKRTACNAVLRQGTPTQYKIDNAARRGAWDDCDLSEMVSAAAVVLSVATAPAKARENASREAAVLSHAAALLKAADPHDGATVAAVVRKAVNTLEKYGIESGAVISDPAKLAARADALRLAIEARKAADRGDLAAAVEAVTRAGYRAVNNYLTDARQIPPPTKPAPILSAPLSTRLSPPFQSRKARRSKRFSKRGEISTKPPRK